MSLGIFSTSCNLLDTSSQVSLEKTIEAINLQGTAMALESTQNAISLQATGLAQQAAMLTQIVPTMQPPQTELPIVATLPPTQPPVVEAEIENKIKTAKILLFEDVSGNNIGLLRYVKMALDDGGYSYVDVGSAQGWLKDKLNSNEAWDLVIIAQELSGRLLNFGPGRISGEYFGYIENQLDKGASVILEIWNLDEISQGSTRRLLQRCGVAFETDWASPPSHSVWFLIPDHPIFQQPNVIEPSLRDYQILWADSGDMLEIKKFSGQPIGDAQILAGSNIQLKETHGLLTTCLGGQLTLQTFATHHHNQEDMIRLWQNYVYNALLSRFSTAQ